MDGGATEASEVNDRVSTPKEIGLSLPYVAPAFRRACTGTRRCPPEGGRYISQNQVLTKTLKPTFSKGFDFAAEAATYKHFGIFLQPVNP